MAEIDGWEVPAALAQVWRDLIDERDRLREALERIAALEESDVWIPLYRASEMAREALGLEVERGR